MHKNKALFLDRDGVINHEFAYVHKIADFEFIDGVFDTCRHFQQLGYKLVVVTNQAGIGYGYYSESDFHQLNDWMLEQFSQRGINIDKVNYCPHHPEKAKGHYLQHCDCRKPAPGMLLQAIEELNIAPGESIMLGDKLSDIKAARAANIKHCLLVKSGHNFTDEQAQQADAVLNSIADLPGYLIS